MTDQEFDQWFLSPSSIKTVLIHTFANISGVETPLFLSNRPYTSDTHVNYDVCIKGGVKFDENMSLDGDASIGSGDIEIQNPSGLRDAWLEYVWTNRRLEVWIGDPRWPLSEYRMIFDGVIANFTSSNRDNFLIELRNKLDRLNEPALSQKLGGSGDNADKLIPAALGEVHNITPLLTSNDQDYRVNNGQIERLIEVRDNGDPRSDITANLGTGVFRVSGHAVVGQITASVQGRKGANYFHDVASLVTMLATEFGPTHQRFTSADLDLTHLSDFSTANPQPVGIYIDTEEGVLAAAQELARSVGAQITCTSKGKLRVIKLAILSAAGRVLTQSDFNYDTFRIVERPAVRAAVKLAYCKNYTVQNSGMAEGLPVSSLNLFKEEWLTVTVNDPAVAAMYRLKEEPKPEETLLLRSIDANAEANRRLTMWKVPRTVFEMQCYAHMLTTELGDTVTIKHPRYGLSAGKNGIVIGVSRDWLGSRATLRVLV